jgi:hypothetical protein
MITALATLLGAWVEPTDPRCAARTECAIDLDRSADQLQRTRQRIQRVDRGGT